MSKYAVIIAAAGKAERFGGEEKKTFARLDGRPVFIRTLEHFVTRKDVVQTILAVAPEDMDTIRTSFGANLGFMGVKVAEGGARRCDTVRKALALLSADAEFVAIHDAARPCVTTEMIDSVFSEAVKTGAAILAAPLTGTIKKVSRERVIESTLSRAGLYEAQTPQVFRRDVILTAYEAGGDDETTDDAQVVERSGHPVSIVLSDGTNLKITTRGDMTLAQAIIKARPVKVIPRAGAFDEAQW